VAKTESMNESEMNELVNLPKHMCTIAMSKANFTKATTMRLLVSHQLLREECIWRAGYLIIVEVMYIQTSNAFSRLHLA